MRKTRRRLRKSEVVSMGLVIMEPYITNILGTAHLIDCIMVFERELRKRREHGEPKKSFDPKSKKKVFAWVLARPRRFKKPIPYTHPNGAVVWVLLPKSI